ncbi:alcohol dehydrogenase [Mycobacterium tuberculosis]|nr:alcohol dehydrogenase [Mycobacterium tuberculosis]
MRAALYERTGPAREVLRVEEVPDPQPAAGEVRVRIRVSGVNPSDLRFRSGSNGVPMAFARQTPGQDGAGVIDEVGPGVDQSRVGERVWVYHAAFGRPGGSAAHYAVVPADQAVPLPPGTSLDQGAGLGIPYLTAHRALTSDGPLDGKVVLVAGGAGAVGNASIQLAKRAGAVVISTVSTRAKAQLARAAGSDHVVVDYRRPDAAEEIRAYSPKGVDRIVEVAPATNLGLDLDVLANGGDIVVYAAEAQPFAPPVQRLMIQNVRLSFLLVYTTQPEALQAAVRDVTAALHEQALIPLPVHRYPLTDIAAAHEAVENNTVGKVLVDLD